MAIIGSGQLKTDRDKSTGILPAGHGASQIEISALTNQPSVYHYPKIQLGDRAGCRVLGLSKFVQ